MKWTKLPKKKGEIEIYTEPVGEDAVGVVIIGTPDGLRY